MNMAESGRSIQKVRNIPTSGYSPPEQFWSFFTRTCHSLAPTCQEGSWAFGVAVEDPRLTFHLHGNLRRGLCVPCESVTVRTQGAIRRVDFRPTSSLTFASLRVTLKDIWKTCLSLMWTAYECHRNPSRKFAELPASNPGLFVVLIGFHKPSFLDS